MNDPLYSLLFRVVLRREFPCVCAALPLRWIEEVSLLSLPLFSSLFSRLSSRFSVLFSIGLVLFVSLLSSSFFCVLLFMLLSHFTCWS